MSNNKSNIKNYMNECIKNESSPCCGNVKDKNDNDIYKNLCELYEKEDSENFFTQRGHSAINNIKKVCFFVIIVISFIMLCSIKKTVDNIDARVHNASSAITK